MFFVAIMLSARLYLWLKLGNIDGGLSVKARRLWVYWFSGVSLYVLITTPIHSASGWSSPMRWWRFLYSDAPFYLDLILDVIVIIAIALYFFNRYTRSTDDSG